jgi:signal peptidase
MTEETAKTGSMKKEKTKTEKIISVATSVLLAFAVLFCGFVMFQIQRDGYVTIAGCSVFHVVSGSMEPEIPVGALIISQQTEIDEIKVGDIVSFRSMESYMQGSVVTHRVVEIHKRDGKLALVTRGDANNSIDSFYVTADNLIGKIIYHTPTGNFVTSLYGFLTNKAGFFVVIIVPVILLTALILQDNMRKIRKEIKYMRRMIKEENMNLENDTAKEKDSERDE